MDTGRNPSDRGDNSLFERFGNRKKVGVALGIVAALGISGCSQEVGANPSPVETSTSQSTDPTEAPAKGLTTPAETNSPNSAETGTPTPSDIDPTHEVPVDTPEFIELLNSIQPELVPYTPDDPQAMFTGLMNLYFESVTAGLDEENYETIQRQIFDVQVKRSADVDTAMEVTFEQLVGDHYGALLAPAGDWRDTMEASIKDLTTQREGAWRAYAAYYSNNNAHDPKQDNVYLSLMNPNPQYMRIETGYVHQDGVDPGGSYIIVEGTVEANVAGIDDEGKIEVDPRRQLRYRLEIKPYTDSSGNTYARVSGIQRR